MNLIIADCAFDNFRVAVQGAIYSAAISVAKLKIYDVIIDNDAVFDCRRRRGAEYPAAAIRSKTSLYSEPGKNTVCVLTAVEIKAAMLCVFTVYDAIRLFAL